MIRACARENPARKEVRVRDGEGQEQSAGGSRQRCQQSCHRETKRCISVRGVSVGAAHLWPSSRSRGGNTVSASSSTVAVDDDASAPWRSRESIEMRLSMRRSKTGGRKEAAGAPARSLDKLRRWWGTRDANTLSNLHAISEAERLKRKQARRGKEKKRYASSDSSKKLANGNSEEQMVSANSGGRHQRD